MTKSQLLPDLFLQSKAVGFSGSFVIIKNAAPKQSFLPFGAAATDIQILSESD